MPRKKMESQAAKSLIASERKKLDEFDAVDDKLSLNLSGGAASALAAIRAKQRWGDRVHFVFADTCSEDEDLYRFLDDLEPIIGPIERLRQKNDDGTDMDIWDCFDKHGMTRMVHAGGACKASVELKQKPLALHAEENGFHFIGIGFNFTEPERIENLNRKLSDKTLLFPLLESPLLGDCEIVGELNSRGIEPPRIYQEGFVHNNCIGAGGCILSGLDQYAAVRKLHPEAFRYAMERESVFFEKTGFSVLRDQRGDESTSYTLKQLDEDAKAGREFGDRWNSNCQCMSGMLFSYDELMEMS